MANSFIEIRVTLGGTATFLGVSEFWLRTFRRRNLNRKNLGRPFLPENSVRSVVEGDPLVRAAVTARKYGVP